MNIVGELTMLSSFSPSQISGGKHLSSGASSFWVSHNTSNTGFSKLLQQHANATAVAFASDATSSHAKSRRISSTLRQGCILDSEDTISQWIGGREGTNSSRTRSISTPQWSRFSRLVCSPRERETRRALGRRRFAEDLPSRATRQVLKWRNPRIVRYCTLPCCNHSAFQCRRRA